MSRVKLYLLFLILTSCAPGWRERAATRADNFGAAIGPSLAECGALTGEAIGRSIGAGVELVTAAYNLDAAAFGRALVKAYGRSEVRCAVARIVERTLRGEQAERGAPAGGGAERMHRADTSNEALARARWLRDNPRAWDAVR